LTKGWVAATQGSWLSVKFSCKVFKARGLVKRGGPREGALWRASPHPFHASPAVRSREHEATSLHMTGLPTPQTTPSPLRRSRVRVAPLTRALRHRCPVSDFPIGGVGASAHVRRLVSADGVRPGQPPVRVPTGVRLRKRTARGALPFPSPFLPPPPLPFSLLPFPSSPLPPPSPRRRRPAAREENFWGVGSEGESVRVTPLPSADGVGCPVT
jgi:hypothetical protein